MDRGLIGTVAAGALAVACCAGGPVLLAAAGGLSLGALLGSGAGVVVFAVAVAAILTRRARSKRTSDFDAGRA